MTRQQLSELVGKLTFTNVAAQIMAAVDELIEDRGRFNVYRGGFLPVANIPAASIDKYPPNRAEDKRGREDRVGTGDDWPENPIDAALYVLTEISKRTAPMGNDSGHPAVYALAYEARKRLAAYVDGYIIDRFRRIDPMPIEESGEMTLEAWELLCEQARGDFIHACGGRVTHVAATPSTPDHIATPFMDHDPAIGAHPENFRGTDGYESVT